MTHFRYLVSRLGQVFGFTFAGRHASNAAAELHLLREAEEVLGRLTWQDLEEVDDISVEYWNLRKLHKEFTERATRIDAANTTLTKSHEKRANLLELVVDSTKDLVAEREELIEKTERLGAERDLILQEARTVKRRHDGIKAKLEVLADEGGGAPAEVMDSSQQELVELKKRFRSLRERRDKLAQRIEEVDHEIEGLDQRIERRRSEMRDEAFGSYQDIGKANRDISQSRAELGMLENEMITLFCEIGRYVSTHDHEKACSAAVRPHRSLIAQMHALRTSINLNNILSGRASEQSG